MRVYIDGKLSTPREVTSRVFHGSELGNLLFLVYANHVARTSSYKAFADDYKLYLRSPKESDAAAIGVETLQKDLNVSEIRSVS